MPQPLSRRLFLALSGGALVSPTVLLGKDGGPLLLDHILLGSSDLQHGIEFVAQHTGVSAVFGGVHPGGGTQNALLSLGEHRYLEIIAPDPTQPDTKNPLVLSLKKSSEPHLVGWATHPGNLSAFATKLKKAGIAFEGPTPGSRARPDGHVLRWQILALEDDSAGLLPFFIEWESDSAHPSVDAPKGCSLARFDAAAPDPENLAKLVAVLGLDLTVTKSEKPQLRAIFTGPKGELPVSS